MPDALFIRVALHHTPHSYQYYIITQFTMSDLWLQYLCGVTLAVEAVLGVVCNSFSLHVLQFGKRTGEWYDGVKSIHNINLASTNLLSALFLPAADFLKGSSLVCIQQKTAQILQVIEESLKSTTALLHIAVCLEVLVILFHPLIFSNYKTRHKLVVSLCAWILAISSSLYPSITSSQDVIVDLPGLTSNESKADITNNNHSVSTNCTCSRTQHWCDQKQHNMLYPAIKFPIFLGMIITCYIIAGSKLQRRTSRFGARGIFRDPNLQVCIGNAVQAFLSSI